MHIKLLYSNHIHNGKWQKKEIDMRQKDLQNVIEQLMKHFP